MGDSRNGLKIKPREAKEKPVGDRLGRSLVYKLDQSIKFGFRDGKGVASQPDMGQDFRQFVKERLAFLKKSQRAFEREMHYKEGSFRSILNGLQAPRLGDLGHMAEALKLNGAEALRLRELALRAHEYHDLADELIALHQRQDQMDRDLADLRAQLRELAK